MSVTVAEVASLIHESGNRNGKRTVQENQLLDCLYRSYCRLEKKDFDVYRLAVNNLHGNRFYIYQSYAKELLQWYMDRYHAGFHMALGRSGGKRTVDEQQNSNKKSFYRFDELYEGHTFLSYLTGEHRIEGTPARDFILHVSVAFLLPPTQVDELLSFYGFPFLHVRNIHHLAIYAVLDDLNGSGDINENPFDSIRSLYEQACQIIFASSSRPGSGAGNPLTGQQMVLEQNSTRYMQGYLFGEHVLSRKNMLLFITRYGEFFDRRHHRLLAEHRKCAVLFFKLYDTSGNDEWGEEPTYNLYKFLSELCLNLKRKRYREYLLDWIIKENRHPTRESMIVLWMYAYCFYFMPEIAVPASFSELDPLKDYGEYVSNNEDYRLQTKPFQDYVDFIGKGKAATGRLHILRYLADRTDKASPLPEGYGLECAALDFYGTEMIVFINSKLREYAWSQLDGKRAFDNVILHLQDLEIHLKSTDFVDQAAYRGEYITWRNQMNIANVPIPLVLITEILRSLKKEMGNKEPLGCGLYEYI